MFCFQILNLFLALLLSSFASESMEGRSGSRKKKKKASVMQRMRKVLLAIKVTSKLRRNLVVPEINVESADGQGPTEKLETTEPTQESEQTEEENEGNMLLILIRFSQYLYYIYLIFNWFS
jgi:hypothetical protein